MRNTSLKREIRIDGDVAYISLTQGAESIIDLADLDLVGGFNWCLLRQKNNCYAVRGVGPRGACRPVRMHRVILGLEDGVVDHINGNGLDNRRCNLRVASRAENNRNQRLKDLNSSGAKGVYWHRGARKWAVSVQCEGKSNYVGLYDDLRDAARAYDAKAIELHGEFALTNEALGFFTEAA